MTWLSRYHSQWVHNLKSSKQYEVESFPTTKFHSLGELNHQCVKLKHGLTFRNMAPDVNDTLIS